MNMIYLSPDASSPTALRYPFVRVRLPELSEIARLLEISFAAGRLSNFGPNCRAFEDEAAALFGPEYNVSTCTSCTAGLSAALMALRLTGAVMMPAFTFPATRSAIAGAGLRAVLADVDPVSGTLRAADIAPCAARHGIGAVMVVRPYGIWSDVSDIAAECRRLGLALVIDNASGFGVAAPVMARYLVPDAIEVFSLHATKPAGIGEGGFMVHPPALGDAIRHAVNFGMAPGSSEVCSAGLNGKMDELRAAAAREMLPGLGGRVAQRQAMAAELTRHAHQAGVQTFQADVEIERSAWQTFPLRLPPGTRMDAVLAAAAERGLQLRRYYSPALDDGAPAGAFPGAADLSSRAMCLPIYDNPGPGEVDDMWGIFAQALDRAG